MLRLLSLNEMKAFSFLNGVLGLSRQGRCSILRAMALGPRMLLEFSLACVVIGWPVGNLVIGSQSLRVLRFLQPGGPGRMGPGPKRANERILTFTS